MVLLWQVDIYSSKQNYLEVNLFLLFLWRVRALQEWWQVSETLDEMFILVS
jgi:hypothetical protein